MFLNRFAAVALVSMAAIAGSTATANATTVTIGLSTDGGTTIFNAGSDTDSFSIANLTYGDYEFNTVSGLTFPIAGGFEAQTASLNAATKKFTNQVLTVYVTVSDIYTPTPTAAGAIDVFSSLTSNTLTSGWTLTEETYIDSTNGVFLNLNSLLLESFTFTGILTHTGSDTPVVTGTPYSLTAVYTVNPHNLKGSANATINVDVTAVPEPSGLALLGLSLIGFGFIKRRGSKDPRAV